MYNPTFSLPADPSVLRRMEVGEVWERTDWQAVTMAMLFTLGEAELLEACRDLNKPARGKR